MRQECIKLIQKQIKAGTYKVPAAKLVKEILKKNPKLEPDVKRIKK